MIAGCRGISKVSKIIKIKWGTWANVPSGGDGVHIRELGHNGEVVVSFGGALPEIPSGSQDVHRYSSFDSDPVGYISH